MDESENLLGRMRTLEHINREFSAEALAKREMADQLRGFANAMASGGASAEQMLEVAAQLRIQLELLAAGSTPSEPKTPAAPTPVPGMEDFRDRSPVTGHANAMAPPASLVPDLDQRVVTGEVTFGPAFEGAPGCVHGGFVAALLDEALGMTCIFGGGPAMTAELTTRYRHHTPVSTPLRVEARLVSVEGRKLRASGEVYHGDIAVVEGSGLFIIVDAAKFQALADAKEQRPASES